MDFDENPIFHGKGVYDNGQFDPPPREYVSCEKCHCPVYPGERIYVYRNLRVCDACLEETVHGMSADEIALEFDVETEERE